MTQTKKNLYYLITGAKKKTLEVITNYIIERFRGSSSYKNVDKK